MFLYFRIYRRTVIFLQRHLPVYLLIASRPRRIHMSGPEGVLREEVEGSASIGMAYLLLRQNLIQFLAITDIAYDDP